MATHIKSAGSIRVVDTIASTTKSTWPVIITRFIGISFTITNNSTVTSTTDSIASIYLTAAMGTMDYIAAIEDSVLVGTNSSGKLGYGGYGYDSGYEKGHAGYRLDHGIAGYANYNDGRSIGWKQLGTTTTKNEDRRRTDHTN